MEKQKNDQKHFTKNESRLKNNLIEMGKDLRDLNLIKEETYEKVIKDFLEVSDNEERNAEIALWDTTLGEGLDDITPADELDALRDRAIRKVLKKNHELIKRLAKK